MGLRKNKEDEARLFYEDGVLRRQLGQDYSDIDEFMPIEGFHGGILKDKPEELLELFVQKVFDYIRNTDVLNYFYNYEQRIVEFEQLLRQDYKKVLIGNLFKGSRNGLGLAWSYFPHHLNIKCGDMKTPVDILTDDELLRRAIRKMIKRNISFSCTGFRSGICYFSGTQRVSNFRPSVAGCIYELFSGDGVVWDMSCGYGGRLLGAMTCDRLKKYIGTDPAELTFKGLTEMRKDFCERSGKEIELHECGSEDYIPKKETLDLCFTSPPYFGHEQYDDANTQSFRKYPTQRMWMYGFMKDTIANCWFGLKDGGLLLLNIANVKSYPTLCGDLISVAEEIGFDFVHKLELGLMHVSKGGMNKVEPIFVFRKGIGSGLYGNAWLEFAKKNVGQLQRRRFGE